MVYLNDQCINTEVPKGYFGGARCTCDKCNKIDNGDHIYKKLFGEFPPENMPVSEIRKKIVNKNRENIFKENGFLDGYGINKNTNKNKSK